METLVLLVLPVGLAVALSALAGSKILTARISLWVALTLLAAAAAGVGLLLAWPETQSRDYALALLLLALPLGFAFLAPASSFLNRRSFWLLGAVPLAFYAGLILALNIGMALGVLAP